MGSISKAEKIDERIWDKYRPTIERLYVKDQKRLEKDDGVIAYMKKHHDFVARYVRHYIPE
jgi:hypothetical protein